MRKLLLALLAIALLCPKVQGQSTWEFDHKTYSFDPTDLHCGPLRYAVMQPMCDGCLGDPVFACQSEPGLSLIDVALQETKWVVDCLAEPCKPPANQPPPQWVAAFPSPPEELTYIADPATAGELVYRNLH